MWSSASPRVSENKYQCFYLIVHFVYYIIDVSLSHDVVFFLHRHFKARAVSDAHRMTQVAASSSSSDSQTSSTPHREGPTEEQRDAERAKKITERQAAKAAIQRSRERQNREKTKDRKAERGAKREY